MVPGSSWLDRRLLRLTLANACLSLALLGFGTDYTQVPSSVSRQSAAKAAVSGISDPGTLPQIPKKNLRAQEQTFLTFPEWFLVFSPREYAAYVKQHTPTDFPYMGHLAQMWTGYALATKASMKYPFNTDYHVMNCIICVSTTFEYGYKSLYEASIGRVSQLTSFGQLVEEDRFAADCAARYAKILDTKAWYDYPFFDDLRVLWSSPLADRNVKDDQWQAVSWFGSGLLRKWERRYLLTTDYAFKGAYGYAMWRAARASYEPEILETVAVLEPGGITSLPRYQAFTTAAREQALKGAQFRSVAGNQESVMISYVLPVPTPPEASFDSSMVMFTQPMLTVPGQQRVVVNVPISELSRVLRWMEPEHVFDY